MSKDYPVVTEGQTIEIFYEDLNKTFRIDIVKAEPAEIISIINTDINVDFDTPRDYVEPKKPSPPPPSPKMLSPGIGENKIISRQTQLESMRSPTSKQFVPFSGHGRRLGDK